MGFGSVVAASPICRFKAMVNMYMVMQIVLALFIYKAIVVISTRVWVAFVKTIRDDAFSKFVTLLKQRK